MAGERPIRIGIVGFGKIAEDQHVPVLRTHPDFELVAIASGRMSGLPEGPRHFGTLADMLAGMPDLDAVALCTPPGPRHALARQALLAGRHVLLEKPPAATLGEIDDLERLARETGRSLFATWHSRFAAAVEEARRHLADEIVTRLRVTWKEDVRHWHPGQAWIWRAGSFGVFDPGINALSIVTRMLPEAVVVRAATLSYPVNRDAPIAAEITFGSITGRPGEFRAEFDWRQTGPQSWDVEIGTASGRVLLLAQGGRDLWVDGDPKRTEGPSEYRAIYDAFAGLVGSRSSEVDASPLRLVADAFLIGRRIEVDPFHD